MLKKKYLTFTMVMITMLAMVFPSYAEGTSAQAYNTNDSTPLFWVILACGIALIIAIALIIVAIVKKKKKK